MDVQEVSIIMKIRKLFLNISIILFFLCLEITYWFQVIQNIWFRHFGSYRKIYLIMKNWSSLMVVYPWLSTPFFDLVSGVLFPLHVNICLHFFLFFFWFWKICNYLGYLMCCVFFRDFSYCSLKDFNKKDFWQPNKMGITLDRLQRIWSVCPVRKNRASNTADTFSVLCVHRS